MRYAMYMYMYRIAVALFINCNTVKLLQRNDINKHDATQLLR